MIQILARKTHLFIFTGMQLIFIFACLFSLCSKIKEARKTNRKKSYWCSVPVLLALLKSNDISDLRPIILVCFFCCCFGHF